MHPKILILTLSHGAAHRRAAKAIQAATLELCPQATVEVIDALRHCTRWFRAYYDSYLIPLRYWPALWGWIESKQHQSESTGPGWLYRRGARPLFRFICDFAPDAVVATEVGMCELASLHKRESQSHYKLAGLELMDFNRAWIQDEVDLYLCTHPDLGAELIAAGAPERRVVTSGQPIDLSFNRLPARDAARARLGMTGDETMLLVLFGGAGFGNPRRILEELKHVQHPLRIVVITGRNARLEKQVRFLAQQLPQCRVLGWVDNMQEWMVAADLMVSKPGGGTLAEGLACGLPMLAVDPLPGNEQRTCQWIEKWGAGSWIKKPEDLAPAVERLLTHPAEARRLRNEARALARPRAAYDGAKAILDLVSVGHSVSAADAPSNLTGKL